MTLFWSRRQTKCFMLIFWHTRANLNKRTAPRLLPHYCLPMVEIWPISNFRFWPPILWFLRKAAHKYIVGTCMPWTLLTKRKFLEKRDSLKLCKLCGDLGIGPCVDRVKLLIMTSETPCEQYCRICMYCRFQYRVKWFWSEMLESNYRFLCYTDSRKQKHWKGNPHKRGDQQTVCGNNGKCTEPKGMVWGFD